MIQHVSFVGYTGARVAVLFCGTTKLTLCMISYLRTHVAALCRSRDLLSLFANDFNGQVSASRFFILWFRIGGGSKLSSEHSFHCWRNLGNHWESKIM